MKLCSRPVTPPFSIDQIMDVAQLCVLRNRSLSAEGALEVCMLTMQATGKIHDYSLNSFSRSVDVMIQMVPNATYDVFCVGR